MFPGYKHVQAFGPDDEYEDEGEVSYVTLDLGGNVDNALLPNTSEYRLAGLDTPTPMLQLSGTFFKGTHEQLIGTELLFTDGRDETNLSRKFVIPVATTEQRIKFQQVEVKEKQADPQEGGAEGEAGDREETYVSSSRGRGKNIGEGGRRGRGSAKGRGTGKGKGKEKAHPIENQLDGEITLDLDTPLSAIL